MGATLDTQPSVSCQGFHLNHTPCQGTGETSIDANAAGDRSQPNHKFGARTTATSPSSGLSFPAQQRSALLRVLETNGREPKETRKTAESCLRSPAELAFFLSFSSRMLSLSPSLAFGAFLFFPSFSTGFEFHMPLEFGISPRQTLSLGRRWGRFYGNGGVGVG
jgi:hypothetical protein